MSDALFAAAIAENRLDIACAGAHHSPTWNTAVAGGGCSNSCGGGGCGRVLEALAVAPALVPPRICRPDRALAVPTAVGAFRGVADDLGQ